MLGGGFVEGWIPRLVGLFILIAVAVTAGRALHVHSWHDILPYSLGWGILMAVLDGFMTVPFAGWQVFADWNVWFGYCVVAIAPLLSLYPGFRRSSASSHV